MIDLNTTLFTVENNARTQINELGGVGSGDTTFTVDSVANFRVGMICTLSNREYIQNSDVTERVRITGISGSDLTVTRNIDGLGAQTFANNEWITGANNAEPIAQLQNILASGWNPFTAGVALEFNSSNSLRTTTNVNLSSLIQVGDKIRWEHSTTGGVRYGTVSVSNYNSTVTNRHYIEIVGSTVLNETVVANSIGYSRYVNPLGFLANLSHYGPRNSGLINGYIIPVVASNNLTLHISTTPYNSSSPSTVTAPTTSNPVYVWIDGVLRTITSATSFTVNAGTNYLSLGSSVFAAREQDLFVYCQWNSTTSSVNLIASRISVARRINDFVNSNTNTKGVLGIINYNTTDSVINIGRFQATLGAFNATPSLSHLWTIPTYTNDNLVQEPIERTRRRTLLPAASADGSMTWTSVTFSLAEYQIIGRQLILYVGAAGTTGGSASGALRIGYPIDPTNTSNLIRGGCSVRDAGNSLGGFYFCGSALNFLKADGTNYGIGANREVYATVIYDII